MPAASIYRWVAGVAFLLHLKRYAHPGTHPVLVDQRDAGRAVRYGDGPRAMALGTLTVR
jgi:hypothetical protein